MERNTKLILAWHLGRRTATDTVDFTEKLRRATKGNFQISTDGFQAYTEAISYSLGAQHVDFTLIIKVYANNPENETRYSPGVCTGLQQGFRLRESRSFESIHKPH